MWYDICVGQSLKTAQLFYEKTCFRSEAEPYVRAARAMRNRTADLLNAMSAIHGQNECKWYKQSDKSKIRA